MKSRLPGECFNVTNLMLKKSSFKYGPQNWQHRLQKTCEIAFFSKLDGWIKILKAMSLVKWEPKQEDVPKDS
jgi:hypothetical protein